MEPKIMTKLHSKIISYRDQIEVRNRWLNERLDNLLPDLMRRYDIDCWVVMAREYNEDPVIMSLLPASMLSCRRTTILVFKMINDELKCYNFSRSSIQPFYESAWTNPKGITWPGFEGKVFSTDPESNFEGDETQFQCLSRVLGELNPINIALNYSDDYAFSDGLSHALYKQFKESIPNHLTDRIISAEKLCIAWLETRIESELAAYTGIVEIAHEIIKEAFSSKVIIPGVTTNTDVKYYMMQKVIDLGLQPWFDYETSIIRQGVRGLGQDTVIMPGDILHCDVGLKYLGLCTDTQHNAYVLKLDEEDVPEGIKALQKDLNRLQDITLSMFEENKTGNEILSLSRKKAIEEGLEPCIYTHPIGYHGHGAGPTIGLWDMQEGVDGKGDYSLNNNTLYALELNILSTIPEWDDQEVLLGGETNILFKDGKTYYIGGRQENLYLIK